MKKIGIAAILAVLSSRPASAEVALKDVRWYVTQKVDAGHRSYVEVSEWVQAPAAHIANKLRVTVTMINRGPAAEEGVLLRYAVSARLKKMGEEQTDGVWTVPFWTDERRIPVINSNISKEIPIDNINLQFFLKKMFLAGFWPDAIKFQVMAEPRQGEGLEERIIEKTLPISGGPSTNNAVPDAQ